MTVDDFLARRQRTEAEQLANVLKLWIKIRNDALYRQPYQSAEVKIRLSEWNGQMARKVEPYLSAFLSDNSNKTADELEALAANLSPGGVHDGGLLVRIVRQYLLDADPLLVAATIYYNWHVGKVGFQFLPDPAKYDPDDVEEYEYDALDLMELFDVATEGDPRRILTGDDLAFYNNLPDRFWIYRGCFGVSPEQAGAGVCWTTRREIAVWFAARGGADPVLVTARIRKGYVRLAKASECEIVTVPQRSRAITCRKSSQRPRMDWSQELVDVAPQSERQE